MAEPTNQQLKRYRNANMSSRFDYGDEESRNGATKIIPGQTKVRLNSLMGQFHRTINTLATPDPPVAKKAYIQEFADVEETFRPHRTRNRRSTRTQTPSSQAASVPDTKTPVSSDDELQAGTCAKRKEPQLPPQSSLSRRGRIAKPNLRQAQDSEDELAENKNLSRAHDTGLSRRGLISTTESKGSLETKSAQERTSKISSTSTIHVESTTAASEQKLEGATSYDYRFLVNAVVSGPHRIEVFDWVWPSNGTDANSVIPKPSGDPARAKKSSLGALDNSWAKVRMSKVQILRHSKISPYVLITRCNAPGVDSKLVAQFTSPNEASRFVEAIAETCPPTTCNIIELKDRVWLESCFRRMMVEQRTHQHNQAEQGASEASQPQPVDAAPARSALKASLVTPAKLKDKMNSGPSPLVISNLRQTRSSGSIDVPQGLLSERPRRQTRQLDSPPEPSPLSWTISHPGWRERWKESLIYPRTGRDRATVDADDIERLDEGVFLNDNLILCYANYLQRQAEANLVTKNVRVYFMNTYFFGVVKPTSKGTGINYESVKRWTNNIDLFEYDYIVVPINESTHWYLAVICHPGKLLPSAEDSEVDEEDIHVVDDCSSSSRRRPTGPNAPRIITLDSLGTPHSTTCTVLRDYLYAEMANRKDIQIEKSSALGLTAKRIPQQMNYSDCGVFVLGFIEWFLKDPDGFTEAIIEKKAPECGIDPSELRNKIRETLFQLQVEYNKETLRLEAEKKTLKALRLANKAKLTSKSAPKTPTQSRQSQVDASIASTDPDQKITAPQKTTPQTGHASTSPTIFKPVSMSSPIKPCTTTKLSAVAPEKRKRQSDANAYGKAPCSDHGVSEKALPRSSIDMGPRFGITGGPKKTDSSGDDSCAYFSAGASEADISEKLMHAPKRPRTQLTNQDDNDDVEVLSASKKRPQDNPSWPNPKLKTSATKVSTTNFSPPSDTKACSAAAAKTTTRIDPFKPSRLIELTAGAFAFLPDSERASRNSQPQVEASQTSPSSSDKATTLTKSGLLQKTPQPRKYSADDTVSPFFMGHHSKYKITKKYSATVPKYDAKAAFVSTKKSTVSSDTPDAIVDISD
ncbi:hypothetical protein BROUX41_003004 [Berkeleyomyces rouxiae]|uniref:uncharacterized protein n=1 Tax=Berkeleyomyces rouxiae TaxID=2035830 RepID=UPI003B79C75E